MAKLQRKLVNGVLLLDKAKDISSNKALQKARFLFNAKKAGHTGTLDPFASGLLVICFGEANKYARWLLDANKQYEFTAELGYESTTGDTEGVVSQKGTIPKITEQDLLAVIKRFTGTIKQVPSKYSAIKVNGQRAYDLARQGQSFDMPEREVTIHRLSLEKRENRLYGSALVSKGTYIRNLVEDIAKSLGTVAYCSELRRTAVNNLTLNHAYSQSELTLLESSQLNKALHPVDILCQQFEETHIEQSDYLTLSYGQPIENQNKLLPNNHLIRLYCKADFIGLGEIKDNKMLPFRLMNTSDIS